ncbi:MAG: hypothetical protein KC713_08590, partial [Candidatus Omnitrophica bacterium]|nr:hypothetical protein [Candidatus Omnitrophota bacterium]
MKKYLFLTVIALSMFVLGIADGVAQLRSQSPVQNEPAAEKKPMKRISFQETSKADARDLFTSYIKNNDDVINVDIPGSPNEKSMEFISFDELITEKDESYQVTGNFKDPETRQTVQVIMVAEIREGALTVTQKLYQKPVVQEKIEPLEEPKPRAKDIEDKVKSLVPKGNSSPKQEKDAKSSSGSPTSIPKEGKINAETVI